MTEEPDTMEPNTAIKQLHDLASIDIPSTRHMALEERVSGIMVMLDDLSKLARNDGCVAAAWALEMIEALQKQNQSLCSLVREYLEAKAFCDEILESYKFDLEPPITPEEFQYELAKQNEKLQALRAALPS